MIHRDDLPIKVLESLQAKYPDKRIICAGDVPLNSPLIPMIEDAKRKVKLAAANSFVDGTCLHCKNKIPDYDTENPNWTPPEGWHVLTSSETGEIRGWQCPACDLETL